MNAREALEQIDEIIIVWRHDDDDPEMVMSDQWVLEQIQQVIDDVTKTGGKS
jgi:hypothetical protein